MPCSPSRLTATTHNSSMHISASEITTLWHYTNLFIIIIIIIIISSSSSSSILSIQTSYTDAMLLLQIITTGNLNYGSYYTWDVESIKGKDADDCNLRSHSMGVCQSVCLSVTRVTVLTHSPDGATSMQPSLRYCSYLFYLSFHPLIFY